MPIIHNNNLHYLEVFLNKYYALINFAIVFLPAIIGVYSYRKYKNTHAKYFIWFCVYVAIVEIIGSYKVIFEKIESLNFINTYFEGTLLENENWWYLIFWTLGGALFYAYYFWILLENNISKKVIKFSAIIFLIFFVINFYLRFNQISSSAQIPINIAQAILILLAVILYFLEILKSNKILSIFSSIHFYIGATILLWNLIMVPLTFYDIYFNRSDMEYSILKALIYLGCNTFMYITFSFALIWCKPQNN